ncbi:MAG: hypothetical protein JST75_03745 [Bacteroidetes bacterium]|nr:hypothetical protein [Bacteroidota bacterium]
MMNMFQQFFKKRKRKCPEDDYIVTITDTFVRVEHPEMKSQVVLWQSLNEILLINTDEGPWFPDVWLCLIGNNSQCFIPQGAKGFETVYEIVSKYNGFQFENVGKSMACTNNAKFILWKKAEPPSE